MQLHAPRFEAVHEGVHCNLSGVPVQRVEPLIRAGAVGDACYEDLLDAIVCVGLFSCSQEPGQEQRVDVLKLSGELSLIHI